MDPVPEPLQWWAYGHYAEVRRQLDRRRRPDDRPVTLPYCRRLIKSHIRAQFKATGDSIWDPRGHAGYERLRRAIMENRTADHDLV
ncbi:MAG TPA: hypothetical protein VFL91_25285 [Thermomicrobiales bacterium]|nr:hypothetical protein [Thermomicrobiales bacterium]